MGIVTVLVNFYFILIEEIDQKAEILIVGVCSIILFTDTSHQFTRSIN